MSRSDIVMLKYQIKTGFSNKTFLIDNRSHFCLNFKVEYNLINNLINILFSFKLPFAYIYKYIYVGLFVSLVNKQSLNYNFFINSHIRHKL